MINVAIIGNNFGRRVHIPAFQSIENVNIVTCSDYNWIDLMCDTGIDAISLSVPPSAAYEILKSAIFNKKHIFCEKPFCSNVKDALDIWSLVKDTDLITAINFEICESRIIKKFKNILLTKKINGFSFNWNTINNNKEHIWKNNILLGGGALNNFGSHVLNLIEYVFSQKINNISGSLLPKLYYNELVNANLYFNSFMGTMTIDTTSNVGSDILMTVHCDDGDLILKNNTPALKNFSLFDNDTLIDQEQDISNIDGRIELTNSIARKFINGIKIGAQIYPNIADGLRVQFLMNQLIEGGFNV
jgi:predicted dehydrogenase